MYSLSFLLKFTNEDILFNEIGRLFQLLAPLYEKDRRSATQFLGISSHDV